MGRFISADTVVPGNASGSMDGVAVKPLTLGFQQTPFLTNLNQENQLGFWFQLSSEEQEQVGNPWGPDDECNKLKEHIEVRTLFTISTLQRDEETRPMGLPPDITWLSLSAAS